MFEEDDLIDEMWEYDQTMNDGEWFEGKNKNNKQSPKSGGGGGCLSVLMVLVLTIALVFTFTGCISYETESPETDLYGPYEVAKVVDGDTVRVIIDGTETKVRMIGINTPESVHSDESKNTEEGREASARVKELIGDGDVYLEYDEEAEDKYGRTLAYVYLEDGETMIERVLLEEGMATTMFVEPNTRYKDEFGALMQEAKAEGEGFWGTGFYN